MAQNRGWTLPDCVEEQWHAYRAETTPPLRSRAEVDADLVTACRRAMDTLQLDTEFFQQYVARLCAEPTAPEPAKDPTVERALDCDLPDPEPCGCEETEALKDQLKECRRLLRYAHEKAREIAQALRET